MYSQDENGKIVITLEKSDYQTLLITLGYAIGCALGKDDPKLGNSIVRLANTINQGNPEWTPYATNIEHV